MPQSRPVAGLMLARSDPPQATLEAGLLVIGGAVGRASTRDPSAAGDGVVTIAARSTSRLASLPVGRKARPHGRAGLSDARSTPHGLVAGPAGGDAPSAPACRPSGAGRASRARFWVRLGRGLMRRVGRTYPARAPRRHASRQGVARGRCRTKRRTERTTVDAQLQEPVAEPGHLGPRTSGACGAQPKLLQEHVGGGGQQDAELVRCEPAAVWCGRSAARRAAP